MADSASVFNFTTNSANYTDVIKEKTVLVKA